MTLKEQSEVHKLHHLFSTCSELKCPKYPPYNWSHFQFAAMRSAGTEQLKGIGWICLALNTPKIKMHYFSVKYCLFLKTLAYCLQPFSERRKMTLLQIFSLLWGTSKVNMQWGGNCWSICLGVAESTEKNERGYLSDISPFMYAAQAEASTFSISRKNGWQWPGFALSDADPNLVLFHGVCACTPESKIWPCEWFYPQMQLMIHTQRKGRMQIPCREAAASHVNKEPSGCAAVSPLELLFPWYTRCCKICFLQGKMLLPLLHYPVWWWTVLRLVPHCMSHVWQVPPAQPFSELLMMAHIL